MWCYLREPRVKVLHELGAANRSAPVRVQVSEESLILLLSPLAWLLAQGPPHPPEQHQLRHIHCTCPHHSPLVPPHLTALVSVERLEAPCELIRPPLSPRALHTAPINSHLCSPSTLRLDAL